MSNNNITFCTNGKVIIEDEHGWRIELSYIEVERIADEHELRYAVQDIKIHLTESDEYGNYDEITDTHDYDREKFTPPIIEALAKEVVARKNNSESIQSTYYFIVDGCRANGYPAKSQAIRLPERRALISARKDKRMEMPNNIYLPCALCGETWNVSPNHGVQYPGYICPCCTRWWVDIEENEGRYAYAQNSLDNRNGRRAATAQS